MAALAINAHCKPFMYTHCSRKPIQCVLIQVVHGKILNEQIISHLNNHLCVVQNLTILNYTFHAISKEDMAAVY